MTTRTAPATRADKVDVHLKSIRASVAKLQKADTLDDYETELAEAAELLDDLVIATTDDLR